MAESVGDFLVSAGRNVVSVVTTSLLGGLGLGYSAAQAARADRKAREAARASLRARTFTRRGTVEPRQLVMGKVRTAGFEAFIGSTGAQKEKLSVVIAVAAHRIAGIDAVYFGEDLLSLDGSGNVTSGGNFVKTTIEDGFATVSVTAGSGSVTLAHLPVGEVRAIVPAGPSGAPEQLFAGSVSGAVVTFTSLAQDGLPFTGTAQVQYQWQRVQARARVRWVLGTDDQAAFADLITQFPGVWTADHRGRGVAYLVAELDYDPDVYPNGPPRVSVVPRGTDQVFDPRTGLTGYSENPALLMRWYLLHPLGGRRKPSQIDEASFIAAANVCDQVVNYGDGARPRFTAGLIVGTEEVPASVCDALADAMAGDWGLSGGVIRVRAGAVGASVADIDETWLSQGSTQIQPGQPLSRIGNAMQGVFVDPGSRWQETPFPRVPQGAEADALLAEDGGIPRVQDLELAAVNHVGQAQHIAAVRLREQRQGMRVSLDCNMKAYSLQLFDVVRLSLPRYLGDTPKLFELEKRSFSLSGGIRLVLRETGSALYEIGASVPAGDFLPNTSLPNPRIVPQIGTVTASSGATVLPDGSVVTRVVLTWPAINDRNVTDGGFVEVGYREAGETVLRRVRADSFTGHTLVGLRGGRGHVFVARAVNGLGVRGQDSAATAHVVYLVRGPITFRQANTPTGDVRDGDVWFDTDAGNAQFLRTGGAWVSVRDAGIQAGLDAAAAAQAAADGKIDSFYQATAPATASEGDLWFDTDDGNRQYIRQGGAWVLAADTRIGAALTAASDAQATADGKVTTFVQATAPTAEAVGDLWLDSDDGNKLYRWSDSAWVALPVGAGGIAPNAATQIAVDSASLAGATYGTPSGEVVRSFTVTPEVDCVVEFTASIEATNVDGDSGNIMGWRVTPAGGSALTLGGQTQPNASKFKHTAFNSFSATGGVLLTFELRFQRPTLNPTMAAFESYMRATLIKR